MPECPTPGCGYRLSRTDTVCPDCGTEVRRPAARAAAPKARQPGLRPVTGAPPAAPAAPPAAGGPAAARLVLKRAGSVTAVAFDLGERNVIGRHDIETGPVDVDLSSLRDDSVSRQHAEIWRERGGDWRIRDLGSKNGTFVQPPGKREPRRVEKGEAEALFDGDEIILGGPRFEFRAEGDGR
jgi:pSer/pThr/pTyr-binding forkhead associated (FHA) protein